MPEFLNWWPAVLGWPAVAASLMLAAAAIVSRHPALLVVSALLAAPFGLYLGGAENWMAVAGAPRSHWRYWREPMPSSADGSFLRGARWPRLREQPAGWGSG